LAGVGGERLDGGGMQWDFAGLAELAAADHEDAVVQVDVVAVQSQRFADAKAGHRQQSQQGFEGGRPKRRPQRAGCGHQRGNVGLGVEVGRGPVASAGQQLGGRHLVGGVDGMQVAGKAPHH